MRTLITTVLLAGFAIGSQAMAEPLGGDVRGLATRFNQIAADIGVHARLSLSRCDSEGKRPVCTYSGGPDLGIVAAGTTDGAALDDLMVIFGGKGSNPLRLLETMLMLMALYAPDAKAPERGVAMESITAQMKSGASSPVYLHGVAFRPARAEGLPLMITVARR